MAKVKKPKTAAERKRLQREREKERLSKIGGKQKSIILYTATLNQVEKIRSIGGYTSFDEVIANSIAIAAYLINCDVSQFNNLLKKARKVNHYEKRNNDYKSQIDKTN